MDNLFRTLRRAVDKGFSDPVRKVARLGILFPLLAGLAIRLLLAPLTVWPHDAYFFYRSALDMMSGLNPYQSGSYIYPPLWAYLLVPTVALFGLLSNPSGFATLVPSMGPLSETVGMMVPTVTTPVFNLAFKLPLIAADTGMAFLLFHWASQSLDPRRGRSVFLYWYLNPLVIFVTAVQGQFDVLPALLTVLGLLLVLRHRHLFAGLSLGAAILFKIYPLFLVPPFLALVVLRQREALRAGSSPQNGIHPVFRFLGGLLAGFLVFAVPSLHTGFLDVTAQRGSPGGVGGLSPFFVVVLDGWDRWPWIAALPSIVFPWTLAFAMAVSVVASLLLLRRIRSGVLPRFHDASLSLVIVALVSLYSSLRVVNPQYVLWILPFLAIASFRWGRLRLATAMVSLGGLLLLVSLQGMAAFWYPLAVSTPFLSVEALNAQVLAYRSLEGVLNASLQKDLIFLASGVGYGGLLLTLRSAVRHRPRSSLFRPAVANGGRDLPQQRTDRPTLSTFVGVFLVLLLVGQVFVLHPGIPPTGAVEGVAFDASDSKLSVNLRGHGLYGATYRVTVVGLARPPQPLPVYLYHDEDRPVLDTTHNVLRALSRELGSQLSLSELGVNFSRVDTAGLMKVLSGPPAVLVVASTTLPSEVFFPEADVVPAWVKAGGVLVWVGTPILAFAADSNGTVVNLHETYPDRIWGPAPLLGFDPVRGPKTTGNATASTRWQEALDIRFPNAHWGAFAPRVEEGNGLVLGGIETGATPRTSLSVFPVESGALVVFGGPPRSSTTFAGPDIIAGDLVRLLLSGVLTNPAATSARLLGTVRVSLAAGEVANVPLAIEPPVDAALIRVLTLSEVDFDELMTARNLVL